MSQVTGTESVLEAIRRPPAMPLSTGGEIIEFMRSRIAHFKRPRSVDFMTAIPRNPTGKILIRVLREPYWTGRTWRVN